MSKLLEMPPLVIELIEQHNERIELGLKEFALNQWAIQTIKKYYPQSREIIKIKKKKR